MIGFKKYATVVLFLAVTLVNAEMKPAYQAIGGLNVILSEDATIKFKGGANFLNQLEQDGDDVRQTSVYHYADEGMTAKEASVGIEIAIGKLGNFEITGGGEFTMLSRTLDDSTVSTDLFVVSPAGLLNFTFPFGNIFKAQYLSRFERRIFRSPSPGNTKSHFRYNAQTRLASEGFLPLKTGLFLFYEGFVQKESKSLSRWGGGLTMEPVKNLLIEGSYSMIWKPNEIESNIYPISVGISYTIDFTN